MTRRMRVLALVMLGAGVSACSMLAGLTEDYRYAADGSTPTTDGGGGDGDGDKDGALPDVGLDGGTDAASDQLAPDGGRFCDTVDKANIDYCNDFEDGTPAATTPKWTGAANTLGASITVASGSGVGGSSALDVDSTSSSMTSRNIYVFKTLPATKAIGSYMRYDVELDFKLLVSAVDYVALGVINFTNASTEDHGVAAYPADDVVSRLFPKSNGVAGALNVWHHAHIVLEHTATGPSFNQTITIDSPDGGVVDMSAVSTTNANATELRIGIFYTTGGAGRIHALFDNIVARRK